MASATVDISVDGDNWTIKTTSTFKNSELKFKLGEEFDEERQDGVKVKSTFTLEDNVLTQVQKGGASGKFNFFFYWLTNIQILSGFPFRLLRLTQPG